MSFFFLLIEKKLIYAEKKKILGNLGKVEVLLGPNGSEVDSNNKNELQNNSG